MENSTIEVMRTYEFFEKIKEGDKNRKAVLRLNGLYVPSRNSKTAFLYHHIGKHFTQCNFMPNAHEQDWVEWIAQNEALLFFNIEEPISPIAYEEKRAEQGRMQTFYAVRDRISAELRKHNLDFACALIRNDSYRFEFWKCEAEQHAQAFSSEYEKFPTGFGLFLS